MSVFDEMRAQAIANQAQSVAVHMPDFTTITAMSFSVFDNGPDRVGYKWSKQRIAITMQLFEQTEEFQPTPSNASVQVTVQMSSPLHWLGYIDERLAKSIPPESYAVMTALHDDCETKPGTLLGLVFDKVSGTHYHWDHLLRFYNTDEPSLECLFRGRMEVIPSFAPVKRISDADPILFGKWDPNKLMMPGTKRRAKK